MTDMDVDNVDNTDMKTRTDTRSGVEMDVDRYMTPSEAAQFMGVSASSLQRWRVRNEGPRYFPLKGGAGGVGGKTRGVRIRYRKIDLIHFMETGEPGVPRPSDGVAAATVSSVWPIVE